MSPSKCVPKLVAPLLDLLAKKIRERGFTQIEVQEALGWGRSHVSMLFHGIKNLHVAEVLSILDVIGAEPKAFFAELYGPPRSAEARRSELAELTTLAVGLTDLLVKNGVVAGGELARAVAAQAGMPGAIPDAEPGDTPVKS